VAVTEERERTTHLKNGQAYRRSLQDGREVHYWGERIEDVTTHFATAGGIDQLCELYDLQFDPVARDVLTYVREDGERVSASYLVPRTKEDLTFRRHGIKYVARKTWGTHGRGIDMIATLPVGMLAQLPSFRRLCPEYAENIVSLVKYFEENNVHLAETIVDSQGYRSRATGTPEGVGPPERATARIVKESSKGIWISGVKGVGTAAPQSNELILGSFHPPLDEESFWVYVPANAPGLRMYCRELVHKPDASRYDHPLASRGEEIEAIVTFEDLFVPRERIVALRQRELHTVNFYNLWARHEHWYTFTRMVTKAELYAGLAQLIVDTLELGEVPIIRHRVADIIEFTRILQGMELAAEELAAPSEGGVMTPDTTIVTAGRSYAQHNLPWVLHILQDICGQGLILRFSEKDIDEGPAAFGKNLGWFLDTRNVSAKDKNLIMNLVWDVTGSEHATRSKLFEEANALNVPFLKERLYGEYDRAQFLQDVRHFLGLGPAPERSYEPRMELPSLTIQSTSGG
jgi:4-hydroxyphenylacetate 3-monooxygenase